MNKYINELEAKIEAANKELDHLAGIEEELSSLDDDERDLFLEDLGVAEPGLYKLIRQSYELLNLKDN